MTEPQTIQSTTEDALRAAGDAALRAGVTIRGLSSLADLEAVSRLVESIWRTGEGSLLRPDLLRALVKAGNYVAGAFDGDELLGGCVGFFGAPAAAAIHSHLAGVSPAARGRSVGYALKLHQRAWAMERGVSAISWTFDPLVRRNAYFNLVKLGADAVEYLPNFYGGLHDGINGSDASDRLLVRWDIGGATAAEAVAGSLRSADAVAARARGAAVALARRPDGGPSAGPGDAATVLVAVPSDIEGLRADDPQCAAEWRSALRETLHGLLATGGRVSGFDRTGWYVIDRTDPARGPQEEDAR